MPNILDYVDWRGDITFDKSPFNDIDNLIFTQLSYINFDGIVPSFLTKTAPLNYHMRQIGFFMSTAKKISIWESLFPTALSLF